MDIHDIIIKPIITESSLKLAEKGKFTFRVNLLSSKDAIKKAVETLFSVKVVRVATSIQKGKTRHSPRSRRITKLAPSKKATVTLKKGQVISLFGVSEDKEEKKTK